MMLKTLLLAFAFTTSVLTVDLRQFSGTGCTGSERLCTNIGQRVCCQATAQAFHGGLCRGCTSTDLSFVYTRSGAVNCYRVRDSGAGGACLRYYGLLRGHTWCRICGTKALEDGQDPSVTINTTEPACTASVEPDLATKDQINYYRIGSSIPADHNAAIQGWLDDEMETSAVREYLQRYKVDYKPSGDE